MSKLKIVEREDINKAWEYYKHIDNLYIGRTNFFLVAESMLLLAFVSVTSEKSIKLSIALLGLIYTTCWLYMNIRLDERMRGLTEDYLKKDTIYAKYIECVKDKRTGTCILSYILPCSTIILWEFFIYKLTNFLIFITSFLTITVIISWLRERIKKK